MIPEFLQDRRFLKQLDALRIKEQTVKITVLNWFEQPIEEIQGRVVSGSVNLDGNSSMRRTATLSIFAEELNNNLENVDNLFALNKKCKVEIGIKNTVNKYRYNKQNESNEFEAITIDYQKMYGDIIWFPLGLFVMFNPSVSHSISGVTISMNLKDKMCLLNGDVGGVIHSSVDFMSMDVQYDENGTVISQKGTLVYDIIKQLVHHWGNESLARIVISEVPLKIKNAVYWNGDTSIWVIRNTFQAASEEGIYNIYLTEKDALEAYESFKKSRDADSTLPMLQLQQIKPGQNLGFTYVDFTYPAKEFTCNAGDTVTSVLDKISQMLGNFEYFYNVEGNFIFQQKKNYLNTSNTAYWKREDNGTTGVLPIDVYVADEYRLSKSVYDFTYNEYTTAYNNSLNYNNIKNDFVVWGARKNSSGNLYPCRFHLAVDRKPDLNVHNLVLYEDDFGVFRGAGWRGQWDNMTDEQILGLELFPNAQDENAKGQIVDVIRGRQSTDWREEIYYQMLEDQVIGTGTNTELNNTYFQYYAELREEFPKIFDLRKIVDKVDDLVIKKQDLIATYQAFSLQAAETEEEQQAKDEVLEAYSEQIDAVQAEIEELNALTTDDAKYYTAIGWTDTMTENPEDIAYFLDFIDEDTLIGQYSVGNIGRRAMVVQDNENLNCVFEPAIPDVVYIDTTLSDAKEIQTLCEATGQSWTQIDDYLASFLSQSGKQNSCFEKVKDLIYQYTHVTNTISITSLPIFHLEPNTRITLEDDAAGLYGDYMIQSISLPLDINSTMTINAYEAEQKI